MDWTYFLTSMVISVLTTVGAVYFRQKLKQKADLLQRQQTAKELAKTTLLQELQDNLKLYLRKFPQNDGSLQDFLEHGNIDIQGTEKVNGEVYRFRLEEWNKVKYEIAKLDPELADSLFRVYQQIEILYAHSLMDSPIFKIDRLGFRNFTENCEKIINELKT